MIYAVRYIVLGIVFLLSNLGIAANEPIDVVIEELANETLIIALKYEAKNTTLYTDLERINAQMKTTQEVREQLQLLIQKDQIKDQLAFNYNSELSEISKIRYLKGLEIIRLLYEKVLALDHHFSAVTTFNEINKISNPNHYPEFVKMKDVIKSKSDKREGFGLTSILGKNIYTSVLHSFVSLFTNNKTSKAEKEASLKEVECIIDFTLRMHNDLNTIYFETAFLQKSNENITKELERLFLDFTKPIKYKTALAECRNSDDWDAVKEHLNAYLEELAKARTDKSKKYKAHKMQINLEFPIDRLLQFITQYNNFINQGSKFYEKFKIMLGSYENAKQCESKIPIAYTELKKSIDIAITKFNTAYKPVEINGSKMKQVLYGISEYD